MTNVLHLINTGGPGGAETVFLGLIRGLDRDRWRPVPVLPNPEWLSERLLEVRVEPIFMRSRVPFEISDLRQLASVVRKQDIQLIHSHLFGPSVVGCLLGIAMRVPVVCTMHGEGDLDPGERFRGLKFRLLNRAAGRVVFVSDPLRRYFLNAGSLRPDLTTVVPNGIDVARFADTRDPSVREEWGIRNEDFLVGAVGNLRTAKGYDVLLRAAALLRERGPGYRFVIVGQAQGELYRELLDLRERLGLQAEVHFAGFRDDVHRVMQAFDLYAITSRSEGFSLSTVQAMATALPVVATRCGGPEEILEHGRTGLLVDPESPEQVAAAIERLRHDAGERQAMAARARNAAHSRFTIEAQVRSYERIYEECLAAVRPQWGSAFARLRGSIFGPAGAVR
jgi:glycosyltransferase involved in cell wall biosynthesis